MSVLFIASHMLLLSCSCFLLGVPELPGLFNASILFKIFHCPYDASLRPANFAWDLALVKYAVTLCSPYQCIELTLCQQAYLLHYLPPTSVLCSATAKTLCWTVQAQDPMLAGLHCIHIQSSPSHFWLGVRFDNNESVCSSCVQFTQWGIYGNKPDALEKCKYIEGSLLPFQPNFNLHLVKHCTG